MPLKNIIFLLEKVKLLQGKDLTIVTMSNSRHEVMGLKDFYKNKISPEVIDLLSISPSYGYNNKIGKNWQTYCNRYVISHFLRVKKLSQIYLKRI